jgi:hypothetical protein
MSYIPSPRTQTAYPANTSNMPTRRPTLTPQHAVETTIDLRSPSTINSDIPRRGSAPAVPVQRRPLPSNNAINDRTSVPQGVPVPTAAQHRLPRLVPPEQAPSHRFPLSAPPRMDPPYGYTQQTHLHPQSQMHGHGQSGRTSRMNVGLEKEKKAGKKKVGCVVM